MPSLAHLVRQFDLDPELVPLLRANALDCAIVEPLAAVNRFTTDDAHRVPRALIAPTTRPEWTALSRVQRRELLIERLRHEKRVRKQLARKRAAERTNAEPSALAPTVAASASSSAITTAPTPAPRAVVPCACGCGELFPSASWRPAVRLCDACRSRQRARLARRREVRARHLARA